MKQTIYILFLSLVLFSCRVEDFPSATVGYLSLTGCKPLVNVQKQISARSIDTGMYIQILNASEGVILEYDPGSVPNKIALEPGSYQIKAFTGSYKEYMNWTNSDLGQPVYYLEQVFEIEYDKITYVDLKVPMINIAFSFDFPDELTDQFASIQLTAGYNGSREVTINEENIAYFMFKESESITYTLITKNTDGETFTQTSSAEVNAGTHYKVIYNFEAQTYLLSK
ncbi:MAG: DUF4493 domain-containing protein [Bacteroidales bacterium]|nr:DUF4493 domain-containing protein [Bacteroidales bacterium]